LFEGIRKYHEKRKAEGQPPKPSLLLLNKYDLWEQMKLENEKLGKKPPLPVEDRFRFNFEHLDDMFDKVMVISALDGNKVAEAKVLGKKLIRLAHILSISIGRIT